MGSLYLGGPTIQEVDGKMMMGLSIYGIAVISGSLYSRFYGMPSCNSYYNIYNVLELKRHHMNTSIRYIYIYIYIYAPKWKKVKQNEYK